MHLKISSANGSHFVGGGWVIRVHPLWRFVVVWHQFYPYTAGLHHWYWGNLITVLNASEAMMLKNYMVNTLRPSHNRRHFADDIFKCIFLNENVWILIKISLKFVPKGLINNIPALVQIMAWRRPGDKPLSETMMVKLLTHICITRPQWVKEETQSAKMVI